VTNNTCAITIDGEECSSCTVIACGDDTDYEFDCSNIIGETWNLCLCTSDFPETSRFLAGGNNERFTQLDCGYGGLGLALCQSFLDDLTYNAKDRRSGRDPSDKRGGKTRLNASPTFVLPECKDKGNTCRYENSKQGEYTEAPGYCSTVSTGCLNNIFFSRNYRWNCRRGTTWSATWDFRRGLRWNWDQRIESLEGDWILNINIQPGPGWAA
jgi:hypothetical protein